MSVPTENRAAATAVRPFRVGVPQEDLVELRRRIGATRWPERETVHDDAQGVPLATTQDLARCWAADHDWRQVEARLNALPGHGFSAKPTATGWDPTRIARAWVVLMGRLGYPRFVAQGGDWARP